MDNNTEAQVDSTQSDESQANVDQTADQLLADIVRNSDFVPNNEESLPTEQVPELDPEQSEEVKTQESEEAVSEEVEEEVQTEEVEVPAEDAAEVATQQPEVYTQDDLDLDAKVSVKIDGKETEVSFGDLIKGYSTEQSLSNKGRELGDARKKLEEEFQGKLGQLDTMSKASLAILYSDEKALADKYHQLEKSIDEARKDSDSFKLNELKDEREEVQKKYWDARNKRDQLGKAVQQQTETEMQKAWQEQIQHFNQTIPTLIPGYDDSKAKQIREFALAEGISEEVLNTVVDPSIVKFVDDYRQLKQGVSQGAVKRKKLPAKKAPVKKAKTVTQQKVDASQALRSKVLSGKGDQSDEKDFLKAMAERSLGNV
tara:strand:+ start:169 stop:1281 length:1113 start_codon:yes stop_codon:yes gene_type:complete